MKGPEITDLILIANKTVEEFSRAGKKYAVLMLDFEKAYDKVNWDFLDFALEKKKVSTRVGGSGQGLLHVCLVFHFDQRQVARKIRWVERYPSRGPLIPLHVHPRCGCTLASYLS